MRILRPVLLRFRLRKPCLLFWISLVCPFIVFLGPQRIDVPSNAGWAEMLVLGTTSAAAPSAGVKPVEAGRAIRGRLGTRVVNVLGRLLAGREAA